jgi:transcriptional repressor NrdR
VGRIVLEGLKEADEVAYLRFASVYKNFQGAQDFEKEMAALDE